MIERAFYSDPNKLDVRPWFRCDLADLLNGIDRSVEAWPPEQREIARRVLEIVAVSVGLDIAPDQVSEVVT